jgi:hypothetical protein
MISMILDLAGHTGLTAVAEGVETELQMEALLKLKCDTDPPRRPLPCSNLRDGAAAPAQAVRERPRGLERRLDDNGLMVTGSYGEQLRARPASGIRAPGTLRPPGGCTTVGPRWPATPGQPPSRARRTGCPHDSEEDDG